MDSSAHGFERLRTPPDLQPRKRRGPQSYKQKELSSFQTLNEFGSRLFPRTSRKDSSSAETLVITLEDPEQRTQLCHNSTLKNLQNCKLKKVGIVLSFSVDSNWLCSNREWIQCFSILCIRYTGWGKSRFTVVSTGNNLFLYNYLLIIVLFSIQTTVNLLLPRPAYYSKLNYERFFREDKFHSVTVCIAFISLTCISSVILHVCTHASGFTYRNSVLFWF